jgi:gliding motility-associated protein GldC
MATEEVKSSSEIVITVGLNEDKLPVQLQWQAQSGQLGDCKALLLSLFDRETKETLKIDLWTLDMEIIEMDRFMFSTLRALADTYFKATSNKELSADFQRFVQYFGEQTEIIKP